MLERVSFYSLSIDSAGSVDVHFFQKAFLLSGVWIRAYMQDAQFRKFYFVINI